MKLRIRGNSIRLRLTKGEVEQFAKSGFVEETLEFGPDQTAFKYQLIARSDETELARFDDGRLFVSVPLEEVNAWTTSDQVGLEYSQPIDHGRTLRILVEKDFACLTERAGEDDSDAFDNPLSAAKS